MKKFLLILLSILCCIFVVSCNNANSTSSKNTSQEEDKLPIQSTPHEEDPPAMLAFSSFEDIKNFIVASENSESYDKYVTDNHIMSVSYNDAQNVVSNILHLPLPYTTLASEMGGTYYIERNEFDLIFKVNGIRYRFIYLFGGRELTYQGEPDLLDVPLEDYNIDLYKRDTCYLGIFECESVNVDVAIYTSQAKDVSFEAFELKPIESIIAD